MGGGPMLPLMLERCMSSMASAPRSLAALDALLRLGGMPLPPLPLLPELVLLLFIVPFSVGDGIVGSVG